MLIQQHEQIGNRESGSVRQILFTGRAGTDEHLRTGTDCVIHSPCSGFFNDLRRIGGKRFSAGAACQRLALPHLLDGIAECFDQLAGGFRFLQISRQTGGIVIGNDSGALLHVQLPCSTSSST